jgi:hypothetical protein
MKMRIAMLAAAWLACSISSTAVAPAAQSGMNMPQSMARYHGAPDLSLTAALVEAGGGSQHFSAVTLLGVLAGAHTNDELASLDQRFGEPAVTQFAKTFTFAIDDALAVATRDGVTLPASPPGLASNGALLSVGLVKAGTMPDNRYDVGYMIEHLVSRPIHIAIMHDIDANPAYGPKNNADFHIILTAVVDDLKKAYAP